MLRSDALALLGRHDWPGNVRELEAALLRALLNLSHPDAIGERELAPYLAPSSAPLFDATLLESRSLSDLRRELEREYLIRLFRRVGGEPRRLMETLKVKRTQLYAWFRRLGIDIRKLGKVVRHTDSITGGAGAIMLRETTAALEESDPWFPILSHTRNLGEKDLSLAVGLGDRLDVELPLAVRAIAGLGAGLGVGPGEIATTFAKENA